VETLTLLLEMVKGKITLIVVGTRTFALLVPRTTRATIHLPGSSCVVGVGSGWRTDHRPTWDSSGDERPSHIVHHRMSCSS